MIQNDNVSILAQKARQIWDAYDVENNLEWEACDNEGEMYGTGFGYATIEDEDGGEWKFEVDEGYYEYPDKFSREGSSVQFTAPDGTEGSFDPDSLDADVEMNEGIIGNVVNKVKDGVRNWLNKGYMEGKPSELEDVLEGDGFKAVNMEKNEGYWVYYITRGDVPFSRHLQEPGGMPIEDLVEDINVFLEDNYRNLEAYEAELGTGRGIPIVIRNRNYSGALPPRANNNVEGTEVDQIAEMVYKVVGRVLKENFGMDEGEC